MDPPIIIQIPCTGSCNGLIECGGPATRAVVAVVERISLVSLALPEEHSIVRSNCIAPPISLTYTHYDVARTTCIYITRMAMVQMLFFLGTAFFAFAKIGAVPARYDQRQDGQINGHGTLKNLLVVAVFPSSSVNTDEVSQLAWNALEAAVLARSKGQGAVKSSEEAGVRQEEPYFAEIQINENHLDKENLVKKGEGDTKTSNVLDQRPAPVGDGQTEKTDRNARNVKNFDFPKSREVPAVPGYYMNLRKTSRPKTRDSGRARTVVGNVWNSDDELERPGTSLKKQLPEEEDVALSSSNAEKNDVSSLAEEKQQELRLLGDGVENCGPGRYRDASGVCQFDESADSL